MRSRGRSGPTWPLLDEFEASRSPWRSLPLCPPKRKRRARRSDGEHARAMRLRCQHRRPGRPPGPGEHAWGTSGRIRGLWRSDNLSFCRIFVSGASRDRTGDLLLAKDGRGSAERQRWSVGPDRAGRGSAVARRRERDVTSGTFLAGSSLETAAAADSGGHARGISGTHAAHNGPPAVPLSPRMSARRIRFVPDPRKARS
jgi:hypothetical protein